MNDDQYVAKRAKLRKAMGELDQGEAGARVRRRELDDDMSHKIASMFHGTLDQLSVVSQALLYYANSLEGRGIGSYPTLVKHVGQLRSAARDLKRKRKHDH